MRIGQDESLRRELEKGRKRGSGSRANAANAAARRARGPSHERSERRAQAARCRAVPLWERDYPSGEIVLGMEIRNHFKAALVDTCARTVRMDVTPKGAASIPQGFVSSATSASGRKKKDGGGPGQGLQTGTGTGKIDKGMEERKSTKLQTIAVNEERYRQMHEKARREAERGIQENAKQREAPVQRDVRQRAERH